MNRCVYVISGPTATGKSALAVELAKRVGGEIISADSMQVYRYMDIGTAKPTKTEMRDIPHHMIDIIEPDYNYSVAEYQSAAKGSIDAVTGRGNTPILVGGSGLYINSITYGLDFSAASPTLI
jgi:tRNA dimethylallyltransferase